LKSMTITHEEKPHRPTDSYSIVLIPKENINTRQSQCEEGI